MVHVDDIMYVGNIGYWRDTSLKQMSAKFKISSSQLSGPGSSIHFLRRTIADMGDWLMLAPGTDAKKLVQSFEKVFGPVRAQMIPCDNGIQLVDESQNLSARDASEFRSIVGSCLYLGRERPDLMPTIKEVASSMAAPTVTRLRKLIGFVKGMGYLGIRLDIPIAGQVKYATGGSTYWVLEPYSDADWSSNKAARRSTSCGVRFLSEQVIHVWQQSKSKASFAEFM